MEEGNQPSFLISEEALLATMKAVGEVLKDSAIKVQRAIMEMVEPIKDKLPESILIEEENIIPSGYRAGIYQAIQFLPKEGKLIVVGRQYMEEREDWLGHSMGVVALDKPWEAWRRDAPQQAWNLHATEILLKIKKVADAVTAGREVLSVEETIAKKLNRGGDFEPAKPLIQL
ncbi:MAG: hypothetical protein WC514_02570 [Candidatus Paceibacterota bacterium]